MYALFSDNRTSASHQQSNSNGLLAVQRDRAETEQSEMVQDVWRLFMLRNFGLMHNLTITLFNRRKQLLETDRLHNVVDEFNSFFS